MSHPTTRSETHAADAARGSEGSATDWAPGAVPNPRRAVRIRDVWSPVSRAVEALSSGAADTVRVLVVGPTAFALEPLLAAAVRAARRYEVTVVDSADEAQLAAESSSFDVAVAVDWLPLLRPSQRERAVRELCRVARSGVVLSGAFGSAEVVAAERVVNALHVAATGEDHPVLGRHLELGLPDVDSVRAWTASSFPHVASEPADRLASWLTLACLDVYERDLLTTADAAMAALLPPAEPCGERTAYRTLVVASTSPVPFLSTAAIAFDEASTAATSLALETAAQRRALESLTEAITNERSRERDEFRAAVGSLATELHEREAQAEVMGADLREHQRVVADQTAYIAAMERRIDETDVHVANLETEREKTNVHVRNLEAERDQLLERIAAIESETGSVIESQRARLTRIPELEQELEEAREYASKVEAVLAETAGTHERLLSSPGGRALTSYVRLKRMLFPKE